MIEQFKRAACVLVFTILLVIFGTGCGTVEGFGRDLEDAGQGLQQEAR